MPKTLSKETVPGKQSFYVGVKGIVQNKMGEVLILQDTATGKWENPGGRIDAGENIDQALYREFSEELPGSKILRIGRIVHAGIPNFTAGRNHKLLLIFFHLTINLPPTITLSQEHIRFTWANISKLEKYDLYEADRAALNKLFRLT